MMALWRGEVIAAGPRDMSKGENIQNDVADQREHGPGTKGAGSTSGGGGGVPGTWTHFSVYSHILESI